MKKLILLIILLMATPCYAGTKLTLTGVTDVKGSALHTMQSAWEVADSELSGDTQTDALGVTERTKKKVDALIAANASNEKFISTYVIPGMWNGIRLRAIGITDGGTRTDHIYFGTLGGREDCELTYAGQLAWIVGTQQSIYDQITFTSGGTYVPQPGETVTGVDSGETAVVYSAPILSGGAWADGDAAGTITYTSATGAFTSGEKISIVSPLGVTQKDVLTHASSDLVDFELADIVVVTAAAWGSSWSTTSPADNTTNAEVEIDIKGADYWVIVTSATSVDTKLLIKGY